MHIHISKRIFGVYLSVSLSQKNLRKLAVCGLKVLKHFHKPKSVEVIECETINTPSPPPTRKINHGF